MPIRIHRESPSFVFLGQFMPRVFHPLMLSKFGLISETDAQEAENLLVFDELAQFVTRAFFIKAEETRLEIRLISPERTLLTDFAKKLFVDMLPAAPVYKLGINIVTVLDAGSEETRDRVGRVLAPQEPWGDIAQHFQPKPGKPQSKGGMIGLVMRENHRYDDQPGYVQIQITPSVEAPNNAGIMINTNSHFDLAEPGGVTGPELALKVIDTYLDGAIDHATKVVDALKGLCEQQARSG